MQIRSSHHKDFPRILDVINDAAEAYRGVIPADRWHEPYMSMDSLSEEIEAGVHFWVAEQDTELTGVMGIQDRDEVALIRHAYVISAVQGEGIGKRMLQHVLRQSSKRILVGTWAAASWAVRFYQRNGFVLFDEEEKNHALSKYWNIPDRQIETSVVLEYQNNLEIE